MRFLRGRAGRAGPKPRRMRFDATAGSQGGGETLLNRSESNQYTLDLVAVDATQLQKSTCL